MQVRNSVVFSLILVVLSYYGLYVSFQYIYPQPNNDLKAKQVRQKMPPKHHDDLKAKDTNRRDKQTTNQSSELPSDFKYILTWTKTPGLKNIPLHGWAYPGLHGFQEAGCKEFRCYLTNNRSYLGT